MVWFVCLAVIGRQEQFWRTSGATSVAIYVVLVITSMLKVPRGDEGCSFPLYRLPVSETDDEGVTLPADDHLDLELLFDDGPFFQVSRERGEKMTCRGQIDDSYSKWHV